MIPKWVFPDVSSKYGAPMGRRDMLPDDPATRIKLNLRRVRMVDYAYDRGGAYWGGWSSTHGGMWVAWGQDDALCVRVFVRAFDRAQAAALVRRVVPGAIIRAGGAS